MNLTYFTVPSFKKKQIALLPFPGSRFPRPTKWGEGQGEGSSFSSQCQDVPQPLVNFVTFCSRLLFLPGALLFFGRATSVQAQFTYTTNNGAITITGYTGPGGAVTIPSAIDELPVTDLGTDAFSEDDIASVTIPNSVTTVGDYAFYNCDDLTNVTIGANVTSIGAYAFSGTEFLDSSLWPIGQSLPQVPQGCPLASVSIPQSVTNIGAGAFTGCDSVTAFAVDPQNPAYSSLSGVLFNKSQTVLIQCPGTYAGPYTIPNSVTTVGDYAFYNCGDLTNVTIGDGVISVGDFAFFDCWSLTSVTIGANVTSIGAYAFSGFGNSPPGDPTDGELFAVGCPLSSVTIPNSVTSIGDNAFAGCYSLANVYFQGNPPSSFGINVFGGDTPVYPQIWPTRWYFSIYYPATATGWTTPTWNGYPAEPYSGYTASFLYSVSGGAVTIAEYNGPGGAVTIPSSIPGVGTVTSIGDLAFAACTSLTSVTIPDGVTNIGAGAFEECWDITSVAIPNGVTSIGGYAFADSGMAAVTIPDGVTNIGDYAFLWCGLTNVIIPSSVISMGEGAFAACLSLDNLYFFGNAPSVGSGVFGPYGGSVGLDPTTAYYLPGTSGWAEFPVFTGIPTALWTLPYPLVLNGSSAVQSNQFGFTISWATNVPVVVEASTDLSNPVWTPIATNTLTGGTSFFSDPLWTNYPARFYRLRSQ